ncbi:hypothetical protein [Borrelia persica]|uniref:hypothetical protein n=1 Tax=Borrelia persica TaxID=44448 RepID=UPI0004663DE2|nr:hypothetical protein [Borrelia persica]
MRRISVILCILVIFSCGENVDDLNSKRRGLGDSGNADVCDGLVFIRLETIVKNIVPRYVTFYIINRLVNVQRAKLHGRTFKLKDGEPKPEFKFSLSKIFPTYPNSDFIFESLNYDKSAIYSLEYILHTLILRDDSIILGDASSLSKFIDFLAFYAKILKVLFYDLLNDETLERIKATKTDIELTLIHHYLQDILERKEKLDNSLREVLVNMVISGKDRKTILSILGEMISTSSSKKPEDEFLQEEGRVIFASEFVELKNLVFRVIKCLIR